jgi:hypothetical protein
MIGLRRQGVLGLALAGLLTLGLMRAAAARGMGDNSALEIGSHGSQPGQFDELRDLTFDRQGNLYTLEGLRWDQDAKYWRGNGRIQKFDPASGKLLLGFPVRDETFGRNEDPQRIACNGAGRLYVTQPAAGVVQQFAPDGSLLRQIALPRASAICRWIVDGKERMAVVASHREALPGKGWTWMAGEQIDAIDPGTGNLLEPIRLPRKLEAVSYVAADAAGNLYLLAAVNQVYKVSPKGELLKIIGAGTNTRNADGSEPLHSLALDSQGNLYTMTWGNPGLVTRFDPGFTTVTQREGQFKWADPWSVHSSYTALAIDPQDRLWVATSHVQNPKGVNYAKYHATPCVLRVQPKFFDAAASGITRRSVLLLGFTPTLATSLPYAIAYDLAPVHVEFRVGPATRQIRQIAVDWRVQDTLGAVVAKGRFELPLTDREPAQRDFTWTPPRFGWYTVTAEMSHQGQRLRAIGRHFGVTPKYPGMVALAEGESAGGWGDVPRQMFAGLSNIRLHCGRAKQSVEQLEKQVDLAIKYGATFFVQFSDKADCTPDIVRAAVSRLKGKVPVWEIMNEPNFSMGPEDYVRLLKELAPIIRELDPKAKVMGPDVCGIDLGWYERFYKAGGGPLVDILSIHDYEGHESIDPVHWRWKFGALGELMAKYHDAAKPVWQTERAIGGVRGENFLGPAQAVRCTLHHDLLETLGVAPEHNNHYYLNEGGYSAVPSYVWSSNGPHPAALALRTRYAMTSGLRYAGTLDFGPTGNRLYLGLRYEGRDGSTLVLRNLGTAEGPLELAVRGGGKLTVIDCFGNDQFVPVKGGTATVSVGQMPVYLRLAKGQTLDVPKLDFGRNVAPQATLHYSAPADGDLALLNNGVLETIHAGHPNGGTDGKRIWQGQLPLAADGSIEPQTLELAWSKPQSVDKVILWGLRADNTFCALLDYDLQYHDGKDWVTLEKVRAAFAPTEAVETSLSTANTWLLDDNLHVHQFKPVTTDRLRLVVRRTTWGFVPDQRSRAWGKTISPKLMLREVEVYAAAVP